MDATKALHENNFSLEQVEAFSSSRNEPEWLLRWRREAWNAFEALPMPGTRYTQVRGLDLTSIEPVTDESAKKISIPKELKALVEDGINEAGELVFVNGRLIQSTLSAVLKKKGVLFTDITQAVEEEPDLVKRYLQKLEKPADRIHALQRALFNGGPFVYIPKGVTVEQPIKTIQFITESGLGAFSQGFLIAEPESSITYLEEFYSPQSELESAALQAAGTRVHVGRGAQVNFAAVQNLSPQVFNFTRRWAQIDQDAKLRWTLGWLGGRLTMSHIENILDGPGAAVEDVQIFFTSGRQHFDLTSNLRHQKPHTKGEVTVKGVLKDKSESAFWGRIRIDPGAQHSNAFQSSRSLIVENGPRSNAIPSLEIEANDVRCTHAASVSQIDEEHIFYLRSRGFTADQARRTIIEGFFEPTIAGIPLPQVQDHLRDLVEQKWQGKI